MHWSGEKTYWDRQRNQVQLFGHAAVHQPGESLTADQIFIDLKNRIVDAKGNCVYVSPEVVIYGAEMHFNLQTHTGIVLEGRISNNSFTLTGETINRLSSNHYKVHKGAYTTCVDCAPTWTFLGDDVDLEFEGYAYMSHVSLKFKDLPLVWFPYLVVPVKTHRQTGFLFPRYGVFGPDNSFYFVLPFFWAINRYSDMTLGLGHYNRIGNRFEWEGRYALTPRSGGTANFYYLKDQQFEDFLRGQRHLTDTSTHRWAFSLTQSHEFPFGIDEKLKILEVSDNLYPSRLGDVRGGGEAFITSEELFFSRSTDEVSTYLAARRFRNLLNLDPNPRAFDPNTVQPYPIAAMTTNDKFLFNSPVAAGLTVGLANFTRSGPLFDRDRDFKAGAPPPDSDSPLRLGQDPIRKATRVSLTPTLYTTLRPWKSLSLVPSLEYRSFFYSFHQAIPDLSRGYLLFQTDLSAQWERVFETTDPDIPRMKHFIRPMMTYSLIPYVHEDKNHPFLKQIQTAQQRNFSGYQFDDNDIVPIDSSPVNSQYFVPLGNSMTFGLVSQLIRRKGKVEESSPSYQRSLELRMGETINFRALSSSTTDPTKQPLSRFLTSVLANYDQWNASLDYQYVPHIPVTETQKRHIVSLTGNYVIERATHQRIMVFDRSVNLGYSYNKVDSQTNSIQGSLNYSLSDYILPSIGITYDLLLNRMNSASSLIQFQSPSRCWKLAVAGSWSWCPPEQRNSSASPFCRTISVDFSLNLTGAGYGGVSDIASNVLKN